MADRHARKASANMENPNTGSFLAFVIGTLVVVAGVALWLMLGQGISATRDVSISIENRGSTIPGLEHADPDRPKQQPAVRAATPEDGVDTGLDSGSNVVRASAQN
jgi:hypothetical protein